MKADIFARALGNPQSLADALGIKADQIYVWRQRGSVPARWVWRVSQVTGVEPHEIDPRNFPAPPKRHKVRA